VTYDFPGAVNGSRPPNKPLRLSHPGDPSQSCLALSRRTNVVQPQQARPLEGITILDLTRVLAGPYCTMILAQLGARIIKVEMPGTGDDSRAFGPFVNGKSLYFSCLNYDKQSIALNLKQPEDRETLEGLLGIADVVIENFRPGTMEKLGFGWETLHERFPNLIYGAASGFGDTGPLTTWWCRAWVAS
jgi:CoA:oxalate CoA-transferase